MGTENVDIIVHIPLEVEFQAFLSQFPSKSLIQTAPNLAYWVGAPSSLSVVVVMQDEMGRSSAQRTCTAILEKFIPKLYICLGIAGSLSKDARLGDVCYTGQIIDIYDNSKIIDSSGGGVDILFDPTFFDTDDRITASLGLVRVMPELRDLKEYWEQEQVELVRSKNLHLVEDHSSHGALTDAPRSINGSIVCGAVSQSNKYKDKLKGIDRNILAIETESGSIFSICRSRSIKALSIRGISDYADPDKSKLEGETKDSVRDIAAKAAVSFLHMQMQNEIFLLALHQDSLAHGQQLTFTDNLEDSILPRTIEQVRDDIDANLRELSPQYRLKPSGYRLPPPRIRPATKIADQERERLQPMEISDATGGYRRIVVQVPPAYPDPALPWILASGLLLRERSGVQIIPVVIDGTKLAPPKSSLAALSGLNPTTDFRSLGGELVFIIKSTKILSKTRTSFLIEDMKNWPEAKFIFLVDEVRNVARVSEFELAVSGTSFSLCDVSFYEIATFLENNFEMPYQEAEATALKLRSTFRRFSLPAHPSFFAGIPSEMLGALLAANRRSELIQLAVDGFLTFVVAEDDDPIRLSRTKRLEFLRRLVVQMSVEKERFDHSKLVEFAKEFSDEYDYGINPISFVNTFIDKGIIHFELDEAKITLPFMEAYLLAMELHSNISLAERFFDASSEGFDNALCYDLYAELGASESILARVINSLEVSTAKISKNRSDHILLSGSIFPKILTNPARLKALSNRIDDARNTIANGSSEKSEKSKILDIADHVGETLSEETDPDSESEYQNKDKHALMDELMRSWTNAVVMLGSGAESIRGGDRQRLIELIIDGGTSIIDIWIELVDSIDFDEITEKMQSDDAFQKRIGIDERGEYNKIVSSMMELFEFMLFSMPIDRIIGELLTQASHGVIGQSLSKTIPNDQIGSIIKGIWLTTIDVNKGKEPMKEALASLPDARFFRVTLATFLIQRVKWDLSNQNVRRALVDVSANLIKAINQTFDKGEIHRFIDADARRVED